MIIEFHTLQVKVTDTLINHIKGELIRLSHIQDKISRAEVKLTEMNELIPPANKKCEIRLAIYGSSITCQRITGDFKKSANEVIRELKKLVKEQVKNEKEPPDEMTSTVNV